MMAVRVVALVIVALFVVLPCVSGATVYVSDTSGSDTAGCGESSTTACKSIGFALQWMVGASDQLELLPGVYSGADNLPISIGSYDVQIIGQQGMCQRSTATHYIEHG
jgi:hypothetical protein